MKKYNVTILDKDTMIERTVDLVAENVRDAHKSAIWSLNDFESEEIVNIQDDDGVILYSSGDGFVDYSHP